MWYNIIMSKNEITKNAIENAFLMLLNERPINEIGIRDIAESCGINRNTFYYHFKNIPDLLEAVVRKMVDEIFGKISAEFCDTGRLFYCGDAASARQQADNLQYLSLYEPSDF